MPKRPFITTGLTMAARPSSRFRALRARATNSARRPQPAISKVPWGVAGMVVLIALFESFIARNWLDFTDPVSLSWRYSALAASAHACDSDLLLVGDSLIKHALIPSVMAEVRGERIVNLGAARCPTSMTYFLLLRSLEAGAHPRAIVFNAKPAVLIGGPDFNQRYWQEVLTVSELSQLFGMMSRGEFVAATLAGRLLPSLRSRLEIRDHLLAALHAEAGPLHDINRALWRNWTLNEGANVVFPQTPFSGELTAKDLKNLHPQVFHAEKSNAKAIHRILQLAQDQNIPVYWLLPPLPPSLQSAREESGAEAAYDRFIEGYLARYLRTLWVLDGRHAGYPATAFADATHLNAKGAIALSRTVAKALASKGDNPSVEAKAITKWIALEPWPDHSDETSSPLEDVETSLAKVKQLGEGRGDAQQ
jgi:hypothetical protein